MPVLRKQRIDPSEISSETLFSILQGDKTRLRNRTGGSVDIRLKSEKFVISKGVFFFDCVKEFEKEVGKERFGNINQGRGAH